MNSFKEMMLTESQTPNAKLAEFLQTRYADFDNILAVEGPDDKIFYHDYCSEKFSNQSFNFFTCDGKKGVIDLKNAIEKYSENLKPIFYFICDKDFDDFLNKKVNGITYTTYYSIESHLADEIFIKYIIKKYSGLDLSNSDLEMFFENLNIKLTSSVEKLKEICCLMLETRSRNIDAKFDKTSIFDFIKINKTSIIKENICTQTISKKWEAPEVESIDNHMRWLDSLNNLDYRIWIRGKYLIQLLKKCFELSFEETLFSKSSKCSKHLGKEGLQITKLAIPRLEYLN